MRVCDLNLRTLGLVSLRSRQWRNLRSDWFLAIILSLMFAAIVHLGGEAWEVCHCSVTDLILCFKYVYCLVV